MPSLSSCSSGGDAVPSPSPLRPRAPKAALRSPRCPRSQNGPTVTAAVTVPVEAHAEMELRG